MIIETFSLVKIVEPIRRTRVTLMVALKIPTEPTFWERLLWKFDEKENCFKYIWKPF